MDRVPDDLELIPDLVYGPENRRPYLLDVLRPKRRASSKQGAPAVLSLHGGAWRMFEKYPEMGVFLARAGFVTFASSYRYSSEAVFPAQLEDATAAVQFIRANASRFGVDAGRVGAWGVSAGGHLACLLGALGEVRATVGVCPVTDLTDPGWPDEPWELIGGRVADQPERARLASPALRVSAASSPCLLIHGRRDMEVPFSQSERLLGALHRAGVSARLEAIPDGDHFINESHAARLESLVLEFFLGTLGPVPN